MAVPTKRRQLLDVETLNTACWLSIRLSIESMEAHVLYCLHAVNGPRKAGTLRPVPIYMQTHSCVIRQW